MIGAILTQSTSWKNVEKAITNLKIADCISLKRINEVDIRSLEGYVRPSGFFRQKAKRLKIFSNYVFSNYASIEQMFEKDAEGLRNELLSINGIGKETADSIALYAAGKPTFVIDAYTKRIMGRIYGTGGDTDYDELRFRISSNIRKDTKIYKDFHAQFVELGKNYCKTKPLCNQCPVKRYCLYNTKRAR